MTPPARISAAIEVLDRILAGVAAELALTTWARSSRFAGSGDRLAVRDLVYDALRRRRSLAWVGGAQTGRGLMLGALRVAGQDPGALFTGQGHAPAPLADAEAGAPLAEAPAAVQADLPDWLFDRLQQDHGPKATDIAQVLRARAPVFLRVNTARLDRSAAQEALARAGIVTRAHPKVNTALEVIEGERKIAQSRAYLDGLVELQDAASQQVALALPLRPGQSALDYCAGGGGKSLALAARGGRVTAHDVAPQRMADLPARAARAATPIAIAGRPAGTFDLVLVDAPCSGSGTWRRAPEAKWRLTPADLDRLCGVQAHILDQAMQHVAPGGRLAYITCSVLAAENADQALAFVGRHAGWRLESQQHLLPGPQGDGFFLAILAPAT